MALALLCPGQGAQSVGMGRDFYQGFGVARRIFDSADQELGFRLSTICFEGPEERLNATDVAQVAIFVCGVAIIETMLETGNLAQAPDMAAGLSLGEYTALHLAGAFTFRDTLHIVKARGAYMQAAATSRPSTMVAVVGADEAAVDEICREAASAGLVVPANYNAPGQIVISGDVDGCALAAKLAEQKGFRTSPLKVAGAFHSPFMRSAADEMAKVLDRAAIAPLKMPVVGNVAAKPHGDAAEIRRLLVEQVTAPVRWYQSIDTLKQLGATEFLEIGPGRALTGLMRRIDRGAKIRNVSAVTDLK